MNKTQSSATKSAIRAELMQLRKSLSPMETHQWGIEICQHIQCFIQLYAFSQGAGFLAFQGEPDLRMLMAASPLSKWGVPSISMQGTLCFYPWTPTTPLSKNTFGFWEPTTLTVPFEFCLPTLILVPALGVDRKGHRIGFGKGHYDRFLAQLNPKTCITMGVVYDACLRDALPQDPWDVPLQYICTQSGWSAT